MPNTLITIEELGDRWVAEVEIGGMSTQRRVVHGGSFEEVMDQIYMAYREARPEEPVKPPRVPDVPLIPVTMPPDRIVRREHRNRSVNRGVQATPQGAFDEEGGGDGTTLEEQVNRERVVTPNLDEPFRRSPGRPRKYA